MSNTQFKIIDTISREIGNPISISGLTTEIKERYGSAYYPNIYNSLISLEKEKIIKIAKYGNTSIPTLNFSNYLLPDTLIEIELQRKREFLKTWPEAQILFANIDSSFSNLSSIRSIILINPARNMKLNRTELLFILGSGEESKFASIDKLISEMKDQLATRIEYVITIESELIDLLKSSERNAIKEMFSNKIAIHLPQNFWILIRNAYTHGFQIRFETEETDPFKISESKLSYNLARFGYKEIGPEIRQESEISIEYIIASILLKDDKRRIAAIPIILAKNKANYRLLAFLSQRFGFAEKLLGLLDVLNDIEPTKEIQEGIEVLRTWGIQPIKADKSHIRNAMLLYGIGGK